MNIELLKKRLAFDMVDAVFKAPREKIQGEMVSCPNYVDGRNDENARLQPLIAQLLRVVEAADKSSKHSYPRHSCGCDLCPALSALSEMAGEK